MKNNLVDQINIANNTLRRQYNVCFKGNEWLKHPTKLRSATYFHRVYARRFGSCQNSGSGTRQFTALLEVRYRKYWLTTAKERPGKDSMPCLGLKTMTSGRKRPTKSSSFWDGKFRASFCVSSFRFHVDLHLGPKARKAVT